MNCQTTKPRQWESGMIEKNIEGGSGLRRKDDSLASPMLTLVACGNGPFDIE